MSEKRWALKVIWLDGEEEFLMQGPNVAVFASRERAQEKRASSA